MGGAEGGGAEGTEGTTKKRFSAEFLSCVDSCRGVIKRERERERDGDRKGTILCAVLLPMIIPNYTHQKATSLVPSRTESTGLVIHTYIHNIHIYMI